MAHILVHLQRTPHGLHPASAVALCLARDVGSDRGATVTGVVVGDAGPTDEGVATAAGRFGCDQVMVGGPGILGDLYRRLHPVHVLTPWTPEGQATTAELPSGPAVPRWVDKRHPDFGGVDAITGVIAGVWPWHRFPTPLEPEYAGDVAAAEIPNWARKLSAALPAFGGLAAGPIRYVAPPDLSHAAQTQLLNLGAEKIGFDDISAGLTGTLLWMDAGLSGIPESIAARDPASSVVLLPGPQGSVQETWSRADWVLPGAWPEILAQLQEAPWRRATN